MEKVEYITIKIPRILLDSIVIVKAISILNKEKYERLREKLGVPKLRRRLNIEPNTGEIIWVGLRALKKLLDEV